MEDLLQTALDAVVNSATTEVIETVVEETVATTAEVSTENLAWEVADVLIDTGAGDALLAITGGPVILVLAYKVFKKWRKTTRKGK